jgi:putative DNA primase/helicase
MSHDERRGANGAEEDEAAEDSARAQSPTQDARRAGLRTPRLSPKEARGDPDEHAKAQETNSIRPARLRQRAQRPTPARTADSGPPKTRDGEEERRAQVQASTGKAESDPWTVPQQVRDRFVQDGHRFYFRDGSLAFRDHGRRLSTASENTEVIGSLIDIARFRGWQEITVEGTESFRREAWHQARLLGVAVRGYKPTVSEHAAMIRALSHQEEETAPAQGPSTSASSSSEPRSPAPSDLAVPEPEARKRSDELIVGKLLDHGRETYRFDPHREISYFVRIGTGQGERTIWGKDLERALEQSLTQPKIGDEVALRRTGSDPVTVKRRERDADGAVLKEEDLATQRHRWVLEKREFFEARVKAANTLRNPAIEPREGAGRHPELVGSYLNLHAAEIAARAMRDPEDRKKFVTLVRNALADSIARGEPLQPVRLRERAVQHPEPEHELSPVRS